LKFAGKKLFHNAHTTYAYSGVNYLCSTPWSEFDESFDRFCPTGHICHNSPWTLYFKAK